MPLPWWRAIMTAAASAPAEAGMDGTDQQAPLLPLMWQPPIHPVGGELARWCSCTDSQARASTGGR
jgi:hypothetical protein